MPFPGLSPALVESLARRGITEPTPPQADVIPRIAKGGHLLLVAPTGIGKTEAAMLPILDAIYREGSESKGIRCIYVTPLRALNRDMLRRMEQYGEDLGISVGVRHGDTPQAERNRQSLHPPQILITTPETLQVLFTGKRLVQHLKSVRWVVIDEIHELSDTERGAQLSVAMERLSMLAGEYQRIGLSATVGNIDDVAGFLSGVGRELTIRKHDTRRDFDITVESPLPDVDDKVLQDRLQSDPDILAVMKRAREIIEGGRSTLFFVNTRETAEWMAARYHLWDESISIEVHHGSLSKENRMEMEEKFKAGEVKSLICTSSLELGIDVGSTDMVIQYNSPRQVSRMIQRAGRAGHRIGETIRARILATAPDEVAESLVVAKRSDTKELEHFSGRECPLSVVANQLIAMTMMGSVTKDQAFRAFARAHPFRNLKMKDMEDVLAQLESIKMVFVDGDSFKRSRKGMNYFYANISMIPDERTYAVRDIGTRAIIGTLDESFVASFAEEYAMFIAKGRTWRIVEMREDEILVEEVRDVGSVPNWVGSDIPVPFEVAMEVGKLRRLRNFDDYPGDDGCRRVLERYFADQDERSVMPTDRTITVEFGDRLVIVNQCFGTKVNETLGKLYAALLTARLGESVGMTADPYRCILELPRNVKRDVVMATIESVKPGTVEALTRMTITNSSFLRWRFVFVAKKFGIIEKEADHRFMNFQRLFDMHKDTPAYREAVNKVLWEDLDIPNAERCVSMIHSGEIQIVQGTVSAIGLEGIVRSKELMQPVRADHSILMAMKKRLEDEVLFASCLFCRSQWRFRCGDAPRRFKCPHCGGVMVAVLKGYERDIIKIKRDDELSAQEKNDVQRLSRNANLVNEYGSRAVLVLAARGVGPDTASRILRSMYADEDDFLRAIMNAEILYAKNKRFWDRSASVHAINPPDRGAPEVDGTSIIEDFPYYIYTPKPVSYPKTFGGIFLKSKYAILAIALMAAAAFVAVPLAADDSAADGDLLIAPLLGDDDMEEYVLPTSISGKITVPSGYYVEPKDDYTMDITASITFSAGSQLRIDAMEPFSLEAEAGFIYFEPGSSVAMGVLDEGYSVPVTEMVAVLIDGQIDYNIEMGTGAFLVFDANLTVYDGTMVTFNHQILLFKGDTTMTANANIDMDMEDFDIEDLDDVPMHVLVDAKLTCGEITYYPDGDDEDTFVTLVSGSYQEYYLEASNPAYLKADKATLDMEVSGEFVFDIDGTEATLTDEAEFNVVVKTGDEIEDLDVDISGSASFEIDVDDYTGDMVTVRDIALTSEVDINNNDLVAASDFQIGELTVISPYFNLSIEGFDYADSTSFKANSLDDLFSLTNILNEYAYMAEYNPSEAKDYIMGCTGAFIEVYFGEELAAEFGELLDELPPMAIYALGYEDGYILSTVPVGTTLKEQFQRIYDGLGADPDFMDYMSGCTDYILKITYGIDEFEAPVLNFTEDLTLDYLMFEGLGYGLEVSGIEMASSITYSDTYECKTEASYDGADATLTFNGSIFQISLPAMSSSSVVDEDGIASDIAVEGDLKVAAVTDEGENYIMYFTVNSDDTLTMDWDSTIAFTTNDKITDIYVSGAYQTYYADTISYKMDVEIEILDIDIDVPDVTGLAKLSASDLTLASIFAGDSFLLEDNFLADDLFLADDDMVGAMPNDIIANDIIPPIDIHIDANVEADVSFSMSDVIVFIPDYMGMYYNLTLDSYKMKASVSFKDENLDGEASASVKDCVASIYNGMYNIAYNVEDMNVEAEVIADNIITIDVTGDMYLTVGSGSDVTDAYVMSNIEGSMDMTTDGESELNSLTFDLKIIDTGITMDFGTVTCDVDDMIFHADEVQIDGIYLDRNTPLYSMGGTVQDVKMGFSGLIPTTFESARADITFTCTTGYLVWQQTVDGNGNRVTCEVDGTFFLDTIEDVECVYGLTHPGIPGMTNHYSFIGEGMAVSNTVYYDQYGGTEMGGTVYAKEELYTGDLLLHIDFTGVALGIDARGFMTVKAQTGFTLDPTTYEGFTVNDQGYVVIDEEILEAGEGVIYAQGIGDKYTLTIDGVSKSVRYGETVNREVGNYFLGMFDENGDAIGEVDGTNWYYTYHFLRDVSLTSVTTTPIGVVPDQITKVTTDNFNFVVPEGEFEYIMVEVPSGMLVEFASEDVTAGEAIRVAVEQTKYEGKDAFMIHSDHSMIIEYPVSSSDVVLYHVVRGVAIPMSCMYYVLDGQTYAVAELSSYSTYYFDEKNGSGDNTYFYLAAIAIAIIVAAALCVPLYLKKKKAGA